MCIKMLLLCQSNHTLQARNPEPSRVNEPFFQNKLQNHDFQRAAPVKIKNKCMSQYTKRLIYFAKQFHQELLGIKILLQRAADCTLRSCKFLTPALRSYISFKDNSEAINVDEIRLCKKLFSINCHIFRFDANYCEEV